MCMSCGCGEPNERHGEEASITHDDLTAAARAAGISEQQAIDNIAETYIDNVSRKAA